MEVKNVSTENLVSIRKLQKKIKTMQLLGFMLTPEIREKVKDLESQLDELIAETEAFNQRFSSYGWCAFDSMSTTLIKKANNAFEVQGIEAAEQVLVVIGKDIPANGEIEDYLEYPYVIPPIEMLHSWKRKNYGNLSMYLQRMFPGNLSEKQRAGECRKLFENKTLDSFEILEIEERACALSKIVICVVWLTAGTKKNCTVNL